jgi:hypothetical protein
MAISQARTVVRRAPTLCWGSSGASVFARIATWTAPTKSRPAPKASLVRWTELLGKS